MHSRPFGLLEIAGQKAKRVVKALKGMGTVDKHNITITRPKDGEKDIFVMVGSKIVATVEATSYEDARTGYDEQALLTYGVVKSTLMEAVLSDEPPNLATKVAEAQFSF